MAIFTPRGLKIGLPTEQAFALMARLHPAVDAFTVLKTAEGLELLPSAMLFLVGIGCFISKVGPVTIALAVAIVCVSFRTMLALGTPLPSWFVRVGTIYSFLSGYGIFLVCVFSIGFFTSGWKGVAAYFLGQFLGVILGGIIEMKATWNAYSQNGSAVTGAEICFFQAYAIHAKRSGVSTDLIVSETELHSMKWREALNDLTVKWPVVVARFTSNSDV
jgi:hypothetical protein